MIVSIILFFIIFFVVVISHEFGHFIVAKKSGILVEEFAVGMGPMIASKQIGETIYSLRAFPIATRASTRGIPANSGQMSLIFPSSVKIFVNGKL